MRIKCVYEEIQASSVDAIMFINYVLQPLAQ